MYLEVSAVELAWQSNPVGYTGSMHKGHSSTNDEIRAITYHIDDAYNFYRKFIYNTEHQAILHAHNFHIAGSIHSINWEVFASILTGDTGKGGYGSDLTNHEVKSSVGKNSFEYQYHLNGGRQKLADDMQVNHIFVSYSPNYENIEVRLVHGSDLRAIFERWLPGLIENYEGENRRQRYRKSIPYGFVKQHGVLILETQQGQLVKSV